jgi:hypothetical protein
MSQITRHTAAANTTLQNILKSTVTGITTLGIDHVQAFGPTIEDIA